MRDPDERLEVRLARVDAFHQTLFYEEGSVWVQSGRRFYTYSKEGVRQVRLTI